MDTIPTITVRVDETGALVDVDVEGQGPPAELTGTKREEPVAHFGDEEFNAQLRPWLAGG